MHIAYSWGMHVSSMHFLFFFFLFFSFSTAIMAASGSLEFLRISFIPLLAASKVLLIYLIQFALKHVCIALPLLLGIF